MRLGFEPSLSIFLISTHAVGERFVRESGIIGGLSQRPHTIARKCVPTVIATPKKAQRKFFLPNYLVYFINYFIFAVEKGDLWAKWPRLTARLSALIQIKKRGKKL